MTKRFAVDAFGWGSLLWLIGYILGFVAYFIVPADAIGWVVSPIGALITIWVLWKRIKFDSVGHTVAIAVIWTLIAVALDYVFIVKMLHPVGGYYKPDVYLYYALTCILPLAVGFWKMKKDGFHGGARL